MPSGAYGFREFSEARPRERKRDRESGGGSANSAPNARLTVPNRKSPPAASKGLPREKGDANAILALASQRPFLPSALERSHLIVIVTFDRFA